MKGNKLIALLVVTGLVAGVVIYVINGVGSSVRSTPRSPISTSPQTTPTNTTPAPTGTQTGSPGSTQAPHAPITYWIEMRETGFIPPRLSIRKGDSVKFINKGTKPAWPASGVHPTHLLCPGFDALKGVLPGESYSYTFNEVKECPFHDHLNPALTGKITIIP